MNRDQLEHIVRASAAITGRREFVLIGSQAVLGRFPEAPPEMRRSMELDIFTVEDPADAELVDGSIGEGSPFHETFGYHAHGVDDSRRFVGGSVFQQRHDPGREDRGRG